jgi:hypothetical protein
MLGWGAYRGYQEGGVGGAIGGLAQETAMFYAFGALAKPAGVALGAGLLGAGMMMGALDIGPKQLMRPYVQEYMRKHAKLEMGTPVLDQFGTVATMRQRSLQAIQNSRVNGRTALGNEAQLLSQGSYFLGR